MPSVYTHTLREASACLLVLLRWALPEPLIAERATGTALTLFIFYLMPKRWARRQLFETMEKNQIEVTFSLGGQHVSVITSDPLPTNKLVARTLAGYAIEYWFEQQGLPVPEFVRNVEYVGCEDYQWDILVLDYLTSIKNSIYEKIESVVRSLPDDCTPEDLVDKFMELNHEDYEKYMRQWEYDKNEKKNPMPHPDELIVDAATIFRINQTN